jgi:hypothetical protein
MKRAWYIYIPDEGDWPINYRGTDEREARDVYLRWAERKRLPAGSRIWCQELECTQSWFGMNRDVPLGKGK